MAHLDHHHIVERNTKIHPLLLEANRLLRILNNQRVTSSEAIKYWTEVEQCHDSFAGIGDIELDLTISASSSPKIWEGRALYFWCFNGAEGGAGVSKVHDIPSEKTVQEPGKLLIEDFWCRLYLICTSFDRPRQLRFVFHQLVMGDQITINKLGFGFVHKNQLKNLVSIMHGEIHGPKEMEKMLSYVNLDDNDCVDFSAFNRLNTICKSLIKPLDVMRRVLRKVWLGEHFWAKHDKKREALEAHYLKDLSELMQQGEFLKENNNPLDLENETNVHQPKVISLKALREAMHAKKLKEKKEAAKLPDVKIPVGERTGHWWREEGPIKIRKKKKNRMQAEAALNANSSSNEVDYSKTLIENATADVLVSIPSAQSKAKEVLKKTRASLKLAKQAMELLEQQAAARIEDNAKKKK